MGTFFLGRYNCIEPIGDGSLGETFRAKIYGVAGSEKQFAVKRIHEALCADPAFIARFLKAGAAAAALGHEKINPIHEVGAQGTRYYVAADLARGIDVGHLLAGLRERDEAITPDAAITLVLDVLDALSYAHSRKDLTPGGVLHLALTPRSVMVSPEGDAKLLDTGLFAALAMPGWATDEHAATLAWMAPELDRGAGDVRSDVFSVGALLHLILSGTQPFAANNAAEVRRRQSAGPPPPPACDGRLQAAIQKALHPDPAARFATVQDLADELRSLLSPKATRARGDLGMLARRLTAPPAPPPAPIDKQMPGDPLAPLETDEVLDFRSAPVNLKDLLLTKPPDPPDVSEIAIEDLDLRSSPLNLKDLLLTKPTEPESPPAVPSPPAPASKQTLLMAAPPPLPGAPKPAPTVEPKAVEPKAVEPKTMLATAPLLPSPAPTVEPKAVEPKAVEPKTGEPKTMLAAAPQLPPLAPTVEPKASEPKAGEAKTMLAPAPQLPSPAPTVEPKASEPKAGEPKAGEAKAGEAKTMLAPAPQLPSPAPTVEPKAVATQATILTDAPVLPPAPRPETRSMEPSAGVKAPATAATVMQEAPRFTPPDGGRRPPEPLRVELPVLPGTAQVTTLPEPPPGRRRWLIVGGAGVAALIGAGLWLVLTPGPTPSQKPAPAEVKTPIKTPEAPIKTAEAPVKTPEAPVKTPETPKKAPVKTPEVAVKTPETPKTPEAPIKTAETPKAPKTAGGASLQVTTTPPGAQLFVDGESKGQSPLQLELAPGRHKVLAVAERSKLKKEEVRVEGPTQLSLTLEPAQVNVSASGTGGLKVRCSKTRGELRILVDGVDTGLNCPNDTRINVEPGEHTVGLYSPRTDKTVEVKAEVKDDPDHSTRVYLSY